MRIALIKNNQIKNVILCESLELAQILFPDYEVIEATDDMEIVKEEITLKSLAEQNKKLESQNKLLTEQVEALSGQLDFQEECIVEMAGIVYA